MAIISKEPRGPIVQRLVLAYRMFKGGHPIDKELTDTFNYWLSLFEEFNKETGKHQHMGCWSCYMDVHLWDKKRQTKDRSI